MSCEPEFKNLRLNKQQFGTEKLRKEIPSVRIIEFSLVALVALLCLLEFFDRFLPKVGIFYFSDLFDRFRVWLAGEECWRSFEDMFGNNSGFYSRMVERGIVKKNVGPNVPRIGSKDSAKPGSNGSILKKMVIGTGATALIGVAAVGANVLLSKNKSKNEKNNKKTENTGESYMYVNGNKPAEENNNENSTELLEQDEESMGEDIEENAAENIVENEEAEDGTDDTNSDENQEEAAGNNENDSEATPESTENESNKAE